MKSNKRLKSSLKRFSTKKVNKEEIYSGELGIPQNGRKIVEVPNRAGYVYARLLTNKNELIQALNTAVPAIYGLPVKIRRVKNTYTIIGKEFTRYSNNGSGVQGGVFPLPRHGGQHSLAPELNMGSDPTWVFGKQFMPMLSYPSGTSSMMLGLSPAFYEYNNQWYYPQVTGVPSFAPYIPTVTGTGRMALYWLDARDNSLNITAGALFSGGITNPAALAPFIPPAPDGYAIPLMAVKLLTGTTALDWNNLYDVRPFFQIMPTGTSGGGTVLNIQDEGTLLGTATTLNFVGDSIDVTISGSVARVFVTGSSGGVLVPPTGTATYFRVGQPIPLISVTGTYWQVPDRVYATGSLGVFWNGHALIVGTDYEEQFPESGTYHYLLVPPTGTYHLNHYGVLGLGGGGGGGIVIQNVGFTAQDEGILLGTGTVLNFMGAGVTATISGTVINVSVPGGGGGTVSGTVIIQDNFNRADAGFVGEPQIGFAPAPNGATGTWGITSNQLAPQSSVAESAILWNPNTSQFIIQATFQAFGDSGMIVRARIAPNTWVLIYPNTGASRWELYRYDGTTYTLLATGGSLPSAGDVVNVTDTGTRIIVKINGVIVIDYPLAYWNVNGLLGFRANSNTTLRIDDLSVTAIGII